MLLRVIFAPKEETMTGTAKELRDAISRSRDGQEHWRCPPDLKEEVVRFVERQRDEGISLETLTRVLGISRSAIERWLRQRHRRIKPVCIVEEPLVPSVLSPVAPGQPSASTGDLVLVTPGGYRIEGLGLDAAVELLRGLGC